MATWVLGDVHGCYRTLRTLLRAVRFEPGADRLWLVGDLVGRGPRSLDVLRFLAEPGLAATVVLGNHDLYLLAVAAGVATLRAKDRMDDLARAYDRDELLGWLARRPLLVRDGATLLLHAGLLPHWSAARAERRAQSAEERLRGPHRTALLAAFRAGKAGGKTVPRALARDAEALSVLSRLRACTPKGEPYERFAGPPSELPRRCRAWFDMPARASAQNLVLCGHWAALGLMVRPDVVALDTGCVWGRALTALRLEDRRIVQQSFVD